jgi:hypothetical protein
MEKGMGASGSKKAEGGITHKSDACATEVDKSVAIDIQNP